jgi:hypothetical protein
MPEVEVFRINDFDKSVNYAFALKTRTAGVWPNEKHYTSNALQPLGKHIGAKRWGYHEGAGGSEMFELDGKVTEITYDYAGLTCFVPWPGA